MNTSRTLSVGLALALSIACSSRPPSTVEDTPSAQENAPEQNEDTQPDLVQEDLPEEDLGKPPRQVPPPTTVSAPGRIVAIGDVHGDLQAARGALMLAGAMDDNDNWIGGDLVVVQVGDQLDRGEGEQAILDLFESLSEQAYQAGGAFYPLLGNHETLNIKLDFRYVFDGGWEDFAEFADGADPNDPDLINEPREHWGRIIAFRPGGPYARILAGHNIVMIVGETLFVHGGVLPTHISYDLARLNSETQAWMRGERDEPQVLRGDDSPIWSRHYSDEPDAADCALLEQVLDGVGLKRMVVAHTVQNGGINVTCQDKVWRIDVGLSAHYGGPRQALEIQGDVVRVLE